MSRRVSFILVLSLCALCAGCKKREKLQQNAVLPDAVVQKAAVPDSGLRIAEVFRREAVIEGNFFS